MSLLPVVERELRVSSRRSITYYSRIAAAAIGMTIVFVILLQSRFMPFGMVGKSLFTATSSIAMMFCMLGGIRFTADSLSEERREGTLGLLFLTDLKGSDVVFGKLAASSLNLLYGVIALIPVLWIAVMHGGVTLGESGRMSLALINALWLSLAVGTWTSAHSRSDQKSIWTSGVLLGLITGFPFLFDYILNLGKFQTAGGLLAFVSPVYAFILAYETAYRSAPEFFWITLIVVNGGAWLLLFSACRRISRFHQDDADDAETSLWNRWDRWSRGTGTAQKKKQREILDANPILWLKNRSRRDRAWTLALIASLSFCCLGVLLQNQSPAGVAGPSPLIQIGSSIVHLAIYILTASSASRFFAEGRRTQSLELLLTTTLPDTAFVEGQRAALLRSVKLSIILLLIWKLALVAGLLSISTKQSTQIPLSGSLKLEYWEYFLLNTVVNIIPIVTSLFALGWVGMWFGICARKPSYAATGAFIIVFVVPFLLSVLVIALMPGFGQLSGILILPALTVTVDLLFIRWAKTKLKADLRASLNRNLSASTSAFSWLAWIRSRRRSVHQ